MCNMLCVPRLQHSDQDMPGAQYVLGGWRANGEAVKRHTG